MYLNNYYKLSILFADVILYLQTVLEAESLSDRAEMQRQQLLEKLTNKVTTSARNSYMDMNERSKGDHLNFFYLEQKNPRQQGPLALQTIGTYFNLNRVFTYNNIIC